MAASNRERMTAMLLGRRVLAVYAGSDPDFVGTGFRVGEDAVITAKHVVDGDEASVMFVEPASTEIVRHVDVTLHPGRADLAVARLAEPHPADSRYLIDENEPILGDRIVSFGYAPIDDDYPEGRMMFGHIQRLFDFESDDGQYAYSACEVAFPAFLGQSGSPVMRDTLSLDPAVRTRERVVALVTGTIRYEDEASAASWATGLVLRPHRDWIASVLD